MKRYWKTKKTHCPYNWTMDNVNSIEEKGEAFADHLEEILQLNEKQTCVFSKFEVVNSVNV
jgi:hypothetical protein